LNVINIYIFDLALPINGRKMTDLRCSVIFNFDDYWRLFL